MKSCHSNIDRYVKKNKTLIYKSIALEDSFKMRTIFRYAKKTLRMPFFSGHLARKVRRYIRSVMNANSRSLLIILHLSATWKERFIYRRITIAYLCIRIALVQTVCSFPSIPRSVLFFFACFRQVTHRVVGKARPLSTRLSRRRCKEDRLIP